MSTIQCIFCLKEKVSSKEHVFPDSLGGLLIIYDVCKDCNDKLGEKVDYHLVDHGLMQLARFTKGLKGKKGTIPNPLSVGKSIEDPNMILRYKHTSDGKPESLYIVPNVISDEDGYRVMVDASEPNRLVEMVNTILKRKGLEPRTQDQILSSAEYKKTDKPQMEIEMVVDMNSYRKAIIKIIYEMTYYWLGKEYLNDTMAVKIRDYILSKELEVDGLIGKVELVSDKKDGLSSLANSDSHIAVLMRDGNKIICYVNIFNSFYGSLVGTHQAELYTGIKDYFLINDTKKKELRENLLIEEFTRNVQSN